MFTRLLNFKSKNTDIDVPDFGPIEINDYNKFLERSKVCFFEKWNIASVTPSKESLSLEASSLSDYTKLKLIGSGSYGKVYLVKSKVNAKLFALKCISKSTILKYNQLEHTKTEKLVLLCINCPFSIRMENYFKDNSYIYFVLPFIQGGELFRLLHTRGRFDEITAMFYVAQIVLALEYLHYFDIIYRDLKPENILVDHTGYLKLADFGFSKHLVSGRTYTLCGTPEYLAPEIIKNKGYGKSVDWWGLGILAYELCAGFTPFQDRKAHNVYEKVIIGVYKFPNTFSSNLKDLIRNILQADISRRYGCLKNGIDDIKNHIWFRTINWQLVLSRKHTPPIKPTFEDPEDVSYFRELGFESIKVSKNEEFPEEFIDF